MKVTLEKKISFVVAGREFDNLKIAQFFQRAIRLHKLDRETPEACAAFLIDHWNGLIFGGKNPMGFTMQQVVELIRNLQMPKVALNGPKKKNVQVLAGDPQSPQTFQRRDTKTFPKKNLPALSDPQTKEFWDEHHTKNQFLEPAPNEQEESCDGFIFS